MGVNKIEINTGNGKETLINISDSTVTPETLTEGFTAYGANGEPVEGTNPYELNATNEEVNTQAELIEQIQAALVGKSTIPDGYIKPTGTKAITENGVYDVTNYAAVEVEVEGAALPDNARIYYVGTANSVLELNFESTAVGVLNG